MICDMDTALRITAACVLAAVLALLVTVVNYVLKLQISQLGGLGSADDVRGCAESDALGDRIGDAEKLA